MALFKKHLLDARHNPCAISRYFTIIIVDFFTDNRFSTLAYFQNYGLFYKDHSFTSQELSNVWLDYFQKPKLDYSQHWDKAT